MDAIVSAHQTDSIIASPTSKVFRFFDRGDFYTVVGEEARILALRFFHSAAVLRAHGSVPTLAVSKLLFVTIVRDLFASEPENEVRVFQGDSSKGWVLSRHGAAGQLHHFQNEIDAEGNPEAEAASVALIHQHPSEKGTVSVAICSTALRILGVGGVRPERLEGLLLQHHVKRCILASEEMDIKRLIQSCSAHKVFVKSGPRTKEKSKDFLLNRLPKVLGVENPAQLPETVQHVLTEESSHLSIALAMIIHELSLESEVETSGPFQGVSVVGKNSMYLSSGTFEALQLFSGKGSDFSVFKFLAKGCKTTMGSRLLHRWLRAPSTDIECIKERQTVVEDLVADTPQLNEIRDVLKRQPDAEKLTLSLRSLKLEDKGALQPMKRALDALVRLYKILLACKDLTNATVKAEKKKISEFLMKRELSSLVESCKEFENRIESIIDARTLRMSFHRKGEFDVRLSAQSSETLKALEKDLKKVNNEIVNHVIAVSKTARADIVRLKAHGRHGEEIVLSESDAQSPPPKKRAKTAKKSKTKKSRVVNLERTSVHGTHLRSSTTDFSEISKNFSFKSLSRDKQGIKFTTNPLTKLVAHHEALDKKFLGAQIGIVREVLSFSSKFWEAFERVASIVAELDVLCAFAYYANVNELSKPEVCEGGEFIVECGRHLLIENVIGKSSFLPNSLETRSSKKPASLTLVSGPNMGGKSTFLRQNALIAILAQIGSYVPAKSAKVPLFDAVLARASASDDSFLGASTFMVEMRDIASIINVASSRSLLIIDEIGRGTSTQDGFRLAKAITQHLIHEVKCMTLFATHFHELSHLEHEFPKLVQNLHMSAEVRNSGVIMLYKIEQGASDKSYGLAVAKMADFPQEILQDAEEALTSMSDAF